MFPSHDTDTGGKLTLMDAPILFEYNSGLGFTNEGVDPINPYRREINKITNKLGFDTKDEPSDLPF